ncbi:MAG: NADAR family protein [Clostridia bacterium]|nr:NADAR family protein [Clostridia bacterium]
MIELKQFRDKWLAEGFDDYIGFYNREFFCLDNFSSFCVCVDGILYCTVEHAYQAIKFIDTAPEVAELITNCYSAYDAQRIAHENIDKQRADWDDVKVSVMERLVRLKLNQNPYVKRKLLETENYTICEDSPKDAFWGIGPNKDGRNELGKIWMKLRDELRTAE